MTFYFVLKQLIIKPKNYLCILFSLQENASLETNFSDKKLLVIITINLDTSLQSKKIIGY